MGKFKRKADAGLRKRREVFDGTKNKQGTTRPGSMSKKKSYGREAKNA